MYKFTFLKYFLFCSCFLISIGGYGQTVQNPRLYSDLINKAELAICDSHYIEAVQYYAEAVQYLKEPFGNDLNNYLACGFLTNTHSAIDYCVSKYKERNYKAPYWKDKKFADTPIKSYFDSVYLHHPAQSKIDTNYRNFINALEKADQDIRNETKVTDYNEHEKRISIVDSILLWKLKRYIDSIGVFPTESVVGNDLNSALGNCLIENLFVNYAAQAGVNNQYKKPVNLHLDQRVLAGEFPPDLYAHLCDSRGYGFDGKPKSKRRERVYGTAFGIRAFIKNNPDYTYADKATWKQEFYHAELSGPALDALNKRRKEMNMEPYEDLIKKITYQMNLNDPIFNLVEFWFLAYSE